MLKAFRGLVIAACMFLLMQAGPAFAGSVTVGDLSIDSPWARASAGMARAGAAFMTITNASNQDDTLVSASATVSKVVELHTHIHDNGVMRMRKVDSIAIPANGTAVLQPGGLHVMFIGLHQPLAQGEIIPVTLQFANAGSVDIQVEVRGVGAR
jgi:copper(I)-binding protein